MKSGTKDKVEGASKEATRKPKETGCAPSSPDHCLFAVAVAVVVDLFGRFAFGVAKMMG
jgi:hypothetical protein